MKKRIVYAGTPDFAVPALQALIDDQGDQFEIVAVYTQPDRPAGRGRKLQPSPVKQCALDANIPVHQPINFKQDTDRNILAELKPDLMVVAAYGLLLPKSVLDIPVLGCVNLHASLLPRWRGAAPIHRAIEAGDSETGITLMSMDVGLDTGDMLDKVVESITEIDTGQSLHDRLAIKGAEILIKNLHALLEGNIQGEAQNGNEACYAKKLTKAESNIDWTQSAKVIERKVRAMNPWPSMQTSVSPSVDRQAVKIWQANLVKDHHNDKNLSPGYILRCDKSGILVATGDGELNITELQLSGKKRVAVADFVNSQDWAGKTLC